jgi:hypothetical protein
VEITERAPQGVRLRAEKGINLPDTDIKTSALTDKDLADLVQIANHMDMVALSFLRGPQGVDRLREELGRLGASNLGVVLKIEKRQAFESLPRILLARLKTPPVGVMIARGDLAVEVGFERLSEVQQEILWLCEAAHVPVIWATQIQGGMAKKGAPARAEVSDAAKHPARVRHAHQGPEHRRDGPLLERRHRRHGRALRQAACDSPPSSRWPSRNRACPSRHQAMSGPPSTLLDPLPTRRLGYLDEGFLPEEPRG